MKKLLCVCLTVAMIAVVFAACSNTNKENEQTTKSEETTASETVSETQKQTDTTKKVATVYFSATGTTKGVAEVIAKETSSELIEIVPKTPYTSDDLNYNSDCRANSEQNDSKARPEIKNDLSAISQYDVIYLGYPIWWGTNPRIIQTFIESYDLSKAEIHLFCTSGSSGIDKSVSNLKSEYPELNIVDGKRFSGSTDSEIKNWLK